MKYNKKNISQLASHYQRALEPACNLKQQVTNSTNTAGSTIASLQCSGGGEEGVVSPLAKKVLHVALNIIPMNPFWQLVAKILQ